MQSDRLGTRQLRADGQALAAGSTPVRAEVARFVSADTGSIPQMGFELTAYVAELGCGRWRPVRRQTPSNRLPWQGSSPSFTRVRVSLQKLQHVFSKRFGTGCHFNTRLKIQPGLRLDFLSMPAFSLGFQRNLADLAVEATKPGAAISYGVQCAALASFLPHRLQSMFEGVPQLNWSLHDLMGALTAAPAGMS